MEGYPVADVAEMLDCAVGTVKSRCSRGRARLAVLLGDPGARGGDRGHAGPGNPDPEPAVPTTDAPRGPPQPPTRSIRPSVRPSDVERSVVPVTDELTPEQEAAVRRLLAEARHDEPVPAEVAARLDEVLDGLVADEGVDDLEVSGRTGRLRDRPGRRPAAAPQRRPAAAGRGRRRGRRGRGRPVAGRHRSRRGRRRRRRRRTAPWPRRPATAPSSPSPSRRRQDDGAGGADCPASVPEPAEADLLDQVAGAAVAHLGQLRRRRPARAAADRRPRGARRPTPASTASVAYAAANGDFVCAAGAYGEGATLPAYYDAEAAVLVLRRPRAGIQRVDLLSAAPPSSSTRSTLPAP